MNIEINATKDQIEEFKSSVLWADITRELATWSEGFRQEMDSIVDDSAESNPSTASVLMHIGDINGRQKAVAYFNGILDVFLDILETKKSEKETNNE